MIITNDYQGVWVFAEQRAGKLSNVVLELLGEGRKIADQRKVELTAVLLGKNLPQLVDDLIKHGADLVLSAEHELLATYTTEAYTKTIYDLITSRKPEILLIGATAISNNLTLLTRNVSDFERLKGIELENWIEQKL